MLPIERLEQRALFSVVADVLGIAADDAPGAAPGALVDSLHTPQVFMANLTSDSEVPTNESRAQGQAIFRLSADGTELTYRLIVANIDNVTAAAIHVGPAGTNGGIVAFLFGNAPAGGGRTSGVLATGTITSADLIGSLAGSQLSDLIAQMSSGNTYVNVNTNDGIGPVNTGPGDFPGGEIRGQIFAPGS